MWGWGGEGVSSASMTQYDGLLRWSVDLKVLLLFQLLVNN